MKKMEESLVRVKEIEELIPYIRGIELWEYYRYPHYCAWGLAYELRKTTLMRFVTFASS